MKMRLLEIVLLASLGVGGCGGAKKENAQAAQAEAAKPKAVSATVYLGSSSKDVVSGIVKFNAEGGVAVVSGDVSGLSPGTHSVRILDLKTCDIKEAQKVSQANEESYVQNIGDITADENGFSVLDAKLTDPKYAPGQVMVIYAAPETNPVKNADARIACGILGNDEF